MIPWNASGLSETAKWSQRLSYYRSTTGLSQKEWSKRRVSLDQLLAERPPERIDDFPYEGTDFSALEFGDVPEYCPSYQLFDRRHDFIESAGNDCDFEYEYTEITTQEEASRNLRRHQRNTSRSQPPERATITSSRFTRNRDLIQNLKALYENRCQICGQRIRVPRLRPDGYSEGHHIRPLEQSGADVPENILIVCPNHHVELQHGGRALSLENLRLHRHVIAPVNVSYHNELIYVPSATRMALR